MKKPMLSALSVTLSLSLFAALPPPGSKALSPAAQARFAKIGGLVTKPGSCVGSVGFVNAQSVIPMSEVQTVINTLKTQLHHNIVAKEGAAPEGVPNVEAVKKSGFAVAVFVIADGKSPSLLFAPDEHWALVNVNALKEGLGDNDKTRLAKRFRGQLMRAFALVCGMGTSQYPGNVYDATGVKDLDSYNPDQMIMDMVQRCSKHLGDIGVTPPYTVPYKKACAEGWAPAPTNDVQRAVMEEVKARKSKTATAK